MKLSKQRILMATAVALIIALSIIVIFQSFDIARPVRVACVGDSITRGTEYTVDLWNSLGPNYVVADFGIGGATVTLNSGTGYNTSVAFKVAKQFQPNIVIIMLGTNDAKASLNEANATFIRDYELLVREFKSLPSKPVVWAVLPPPIFNNTMSVSEQLLEQNVIPNIREVSSQMGTGLIDVHTPLVGHPELFLDGVHPSSDGAKVIANTIYTALISGNN
jgi:lysophospholipase L1-like esterase